MLSALGNIVSPAKSETVLTPFTYSLDFDSLKKVKMFPGKEIMRPF